MPFTFSGSSLDRLERYFTVQFHVAAAADAIDSFVWMAPFHCHFRGCRFVADTVSSSAGATVTPRKITADATDAGAAAGATVIELTADIPTDGTDNTAETPDLASGVTAGDLHFKPGDRLAVDFSATQTALAGATLVFVFERE